jgi:hypothetical protein
MFCHPVRNNQVVVKKPCEVSCEIISAAARNKRFEDARVPGGDRDCFAR